MKLVVVSPEADDPREIAVLSALLDAGLERYHVRKPHWSLAQLETWLSALPKDWRTRLVLHSHHELVGKLGFLGRHWKDEGAGRGACPQDACSSIQHSTFNIQRSTRQFTSRSCHDLDTLSDSIDKYDSVFFGPVFPSISKPGYSGKCSHDELSALLHARAGTPRHSTVLALGGVTAERLAQVRALGFDGAAVFGAIWQAADPIAVFRELQSTVSTLNPVSRSHAA